MRQKQEGEGRLKILHFQERGQKLKEGAHLQMTDYSNITYDGHDEAFIDEEKFVLPELTADMQILMPC